MALIICYNVYNKFFKKGIEIIMHNPPVEMILLRQVEILSDITAPKPPRKPDCEHPEPPKHEFAPDKRPPFPPPMNPHRHFGFLLFAIKHHDGITINDIITHSHGECPDEIKKHIAHIVEDGLIENRDEKLYITEKGEETIKEIHHRREEKAADLFGALNAEEKEDLKNLLDKVIKSKLPPPPEHH